MRTGNPALSDKSFQNNIGMGNDSMTLDGSVNKSFLLIAITIASAVGVWIHAAMFMPYYIVIAIVGFVLAMIIIFKPTTSPYLAPVYAIVEGIFIGAVSAVYEQAFPGIVMQAAGLTFGIFVAMLLAYKSRLIQATENFKLGVVAATGGIMLVYLASLLGHFTGWFSLGFLHDSSPLSIGISVFIVLVASLNLVLDFDFIENGVERGAPKYMEWYAAFGLLVTLVWLYLEILRLLAKIRD